MAAPTFRSAGAKTTGGGGAVLTVAAPAGIAIGDLEILVASKDVSTAFVLSNNGGSAWTSLGDGIGAGGAEHCTMWWRVRQAGDTNPQITVPAGAQHGIAARIAVTAGTFDTSSPLEIFAWSTGPSSTAFSLAAGTTLGVDRLVFGFCSSSADSNSHQVPVMTNAALTGLTQVFTSHNTNVGDGGGFGATCGVKAVAGASGTFACTLGTATLQVRAYWAVKPVPPPPPPDNETLIDDFNRADGQLDAGAGSAIWTQTYYDNPARTDLRIVGNQFAGISNWQSAYTKFDLAADFDLLIDCVAPPVTPNFEFGMFFSMTNPGTSGFNGYGVFWGNGSWFMRRYTGGVNQGSIATASGPLLAGDTLWIRKRSSDIKFYRRPSGGEYSLLMTATDATYGAGVVVVELSDATQRWDNLRGGPRGGPIGKFALPITFGKSVQGIAIPAPQYQKTVIADGATGYWRMEEVGAPKSWAPGTGKDFLTQSGTVNRVGGLLPNVPNAYAKYFGLGYLLRSGAIFPINTFTLEAWIRRDSAVYNEMIMCHYDQGFQLQFNSDGTLGLRQSQGQAGVKSSVLKYNDLQTHHIVVTRAGIGGEVVFYRNGVPEIVSGAAFTADFSVTTWGLYIADDYNSFIPFQGTIDEMAIYPTVLTPAQVLNHYDLATHIATTLYGAVAFPISFNKDIKGVRKTFGKMVFPIVFAKDVNGLRKAFGAILAPFTFGKDIRGQKKTFGQVALSITMNIATAAAEPSRLVYGAFTSALTFDKDIRGVKKTFSAILVPLTFGKDVKGQRKTFGQMSLPLTIAIATKGIRPAFTQYGSMAVSFIFGKNVQGGQRKTFGQIALPVIFSKQVSGFKKTFSKVALPIIFVKDVAAYRTTLGKITRPFIFASVIQGRRLRLGSFTFPMYFAINVKDGRVKAYSKTSFPIVIDITIAGKRIRGAVVLNEATAIYLGTQQVDAVYTDGQKVWPQT